MSQTLTSKELSLPGALEIEDSHGLDAQISQAQVVLYNQHSGLPDGREPGDENLRRFLMLERDTGVREIANGVYSRLTEAGIHVILATVVPPRGLYDTNRLPESGHQLPTHIEDENLRDGFLEVHRSLVANLLKLSKGARNALSLDLHSMAPMHPAGAVKPHIDDSETLERYVHQWNSNARLTDPARNRETTLITMADSRVVGNEQLAGKLLDGFHFAGQAVDVNQWMTLSQGIHTGTRLIAEGKGGVILDVAKAGLVSTPQRELDLTRMELDPEKVDRIAEIIATSAVATLSGK